MIDNGKELTIGRAIGDWSRTSSEATVSIPGRTHRRWTKEEDEYLRATFKTTPAREIAVRLGRTRSGVAQRAFKVLLLPRKRARPLGVRWAPEADAFLHTNYGVVRTREIAGTLHRTVNAVHDRAHILRLTRRTVRGPNRAWSVQDEQYVLANYGKVSREESRNGSIGLRRPFLAEAERRPGVPHRKEDRGEIGIPWRMPCCARGTGKGP